MIKILILNDDKNVKSMTTNYSLMENFCVIKPNNKHLIIFCFLFVINIISNLENFVQKVKFILSFRI